jgi:uncharacterized protein with FMN-binding domain
VVNRVRPRTGRRNAGVLAATGIVAGLLFVYPTSLNHPTGPVIAAEAATAVRTSNDFSAQTPTAATAVGSGSGGSTSSGSASSATRTVTGSAVNTRWGPVQVQIQVSGSKLISAQAVVYPQENGRDLEINRYAVPALNRAAVAAQGADIDTISGATYTSIGYRQSLQSALDAANLL